MKPMKVGVIGAGIISEIYLENMTGRFGDRLEVTRIAANHVEHAARRAAQFSPAVEARYGHGITACTNAEVYADPEVEMIVNLTPVGAHYGIIRDALNAGKHVYTEKTITDDLAQAAELVKLADDRGLYLGSAPDTFLGAALQTARKAIDDGRLGTVTGFAACANRDNDTLLTLFKFLREPGAGVALDYAVYYMTALVSLLGPVAETAAYIRAPYPAHVNRNPADPEFGKTFDAPNESEISAILRMESGVTGTFTLAGDSILQDKAYFTIHGTKGMLVLCDPNGFGGDVKLIPNTDFFHPANPINPWEGAPEEVLPPVSIYGDNCRGIGPWEMAGAIREGRPNRASKELAYHVLDVLTAMLRSGAAHTFAEVPSTCGRPEPFRE